MSETDTNSLDFARHVLRSLPDSVAEVAADGRILFYNLDPLFENVLGRTIYDFVLPEYREAAERGIRTVLATDQPVDFRVRAGSVQDSGIHFFQLRLQPFAGGRPEKTVLLIATRLPRLNRTETLLSESKQRLQYVLQSNHIGTWEYDLLSAKLFWDEQNYALHGLRQSDYPNTMEAWRKVTPRAEQLRSEKLWREAIEGEKELEMTSKIAWPTGEVRYIRFRGRLLKDAEIPPRFVGVCWDVTIEVCLQEELSVQKLKSIQAAKMATLGEMAGGIAHEINNPLTIIQGYGMHLGELAAAAGESPGEPGVPTGIVSSLAQKIVSTTERIAAIIRGLRSFARESTNDPCNVVSIRKIVSDTLALCQSRLQNMKIETTVDIREDYPVECREVAISQALLNLISNAADAVQGQVVRRIRIEASLRPNDPRMLALSVTDSGRGVPAEIASRIMEPFFSTKQPGQGVGLGLSISAGLIETHGGRLYLDSQSHETRFVIELPITQVSAAP